MNKSDLKQMSKVKLNDIIEFKDGSQYKVIKVFTGNIVDFHCCCIGFFFIYHKRKNKQGCD